jgi:elongation factor P
MASTNDLKKGIYVEIEGEVWRVIEFQHTKPGKGHAFVRIKMKNVVDGHIVDRKFRSDEYLKDADVFRKNMQFLYKDGSDFVFMDASTYEQYHLNEDFIGDDALFMKENMQVSMLLHNEKPIGLEIPVAVVLKIVKTEPGFKGNTVTGSSKPATLETGGVVQVPLFVDEGTNIKIDTRTKTYIERVS